MSKRNARSAACPLLKEHMAGSFLGVSGVISGSRHWQKAAEWYWGQFHGIYQNLPLQLRRLKERSDLWHCSMSTLCYVVVERGDCGVKSAWALIMAVPQFMYYVINLTSLSLCLLISRWRWKQKLPYRVVLNTERDFYKELSTVLHTQ